MNRKIAIAAIAASVALAVAAEESKEFRIEFNPKGEVIKDVSKSPCFPDLGLAGENTAPGIFNDAYLSYVKNREMTARAYREAGVWLVRPCDMLNVFAGIAKHPGQDWAIDEKTGRCQWLHPKYNFSFWKEYGLKAIICLNIWNDEPDKVANLEAFLKWIVENGWQDQVSAFEMCNEAFYGKDPENYARYWKNLLPIIRKHMPKTAIGMPIAEYCPGDPDIEAVKKRLLGDSKLGSDYFTANNLNRWSARAIVAMSNDLQYVSHLIYHVYGAAGAYGCSMTGFHRFRNFAKVFPQVKDKRWLITEWRPWSDGSEQLMRSFREVVWSGMYIQTAFCQPELDGFTLHELTSISGVLYYSAHGKWNQYYDSWENGRDLRAVGPTPNLRDLVGRGDLRYEASGMGQLFRLYNQAVITHPLIVGYGSKRCGAKNPGAFYCSANYDGGNYKKSADCQWTALVNPHRSSMCLMLANGTDEKLTVPVKCYGYRLLSKTHRFVTIEDEYLNTRDVLGEEKMWRAVNFETASDGNPESPQFVTVPPRSVGTVMIGLRPWDEWWAVHLGRQMINRAVAAAKKSAAKDAKPSAECCGVTRGKTRMTLPDGYPGHPEVKENLPARKWCERIGAGGKLDAAAIAEAKKAGYHVVDNGKDAAWLFRTTDIPAAEAEALCAKLQEMAGF